MILRIISIDILPNNKYKTPNQIEKHIIITATLKHRRPLKRVGCSQNHAEFSMYLLISEGRFSYWRWRRVRLSNSVGYYCPELPRPPLRPLNSFILQPGLARVGCSWPCRSREFTWKNINKLLIAISGQHNLR